MQTEYEEYTTESEREEDISYTLPSHREYEEFYFLETMDLILVLAILVQIGHTVPSPDCLLNVR